MRKFIRQGYRSRHPASTGRISQRALVIVAALLTCAGTARLGLWQLDRAAQKIALQSQIEQRASLPALTPADLAAAAAQADPAAALAALLQRPVALRGVWQPQATVYLDNRPMDGRVGFIVVTPLLLPQGGAIAVQRGWMPRDITDRSRLQPLQTPAGEVSVTGRLAAWPSAMYAMGQESDGPIRQNLDAAALQRAAGARLLPASVLMALPASTAVTAESAADGLLRDWPAPALDLQKHYGYAAQWFGLSALVAGLTVWFQFLQPWRRARRVAPGAPSCESPRTPS